MAVVLDQMLVIFTSGRSSGTRCLFICAATVENLDKLLKDQVFQNYTGQIDGCQLMRVEPDARPIDPELRLPDTVKALEMRRPQISISGGARAACGKRNEASAQPHLSRGTENSLWNLNPRLTRLREKQRQTKRKCMANLICQTRDYNSSWNLNSQSHDWGWPERSALNFYALWSAVTG